MLSANPATRVPSRAPVQPGRRIRVTGLVGGTAMAMGAYGIAHLPSEGWLAGVPGVATLRTHPFGAPVSVVLVVVGVTLITGAWLALGRRILRGGVWRDPRDLVRTFWLWSLPLVLAPPLFSRDLWSYAAQGNLLRLGVDPYQVGPSAVPGQFLDSVDPLWADSPAPYGPLFLVLARAVAQLTYFDTQLTALGMRLLAVAGVWLIARYLPRLASSCGVDPTRAVWLGLLNPLVIMHFVSGAHNDALMVGLIVMALALAFEGSVVFGAVVAAAAVAVKAPAVVALGGIGILYAADLDGRLRRLRGCLAIGALGGSAFVLITMVSGLGYGWLQALDTPGTVRTWLSLPTAAGMLLGRLGGMLGYGYHTDGLITTCRLIGGLVAAGLIAAMLLRPGRISPVRTVAISLLAVVALGPVVHPWYLLWGPIILAAAHISRFEQAALAWTSVWFVVDSVVHGSVMPRELAGVGTLGAIGAGVGLVAWHAVAVAAERREERREELRTARIQAVEPSLPVP